MFLDYDKFPFEGNSTKKYQFHAQSIESDLPSVGAVYFVGRMVARQGDKPDLRLFHLGRTDDLNRALFHRKLAPLDDSQAPNVIFWLEADNDWARLAIQQDLSKHPVNTQD